MIVDNKHEIVLSEYWADQQQPSPRPLSYWLESYPAAASEIIDFASYLRGVEAHALSRTSTESDLDKLRKQMLSVSQQMRDNATELAAEPFTSILKRAKGLGFTPISLAGKLSLSLSLLTKLERRAFQWNTIPTRFLDDLSNLIQVSIDDLSAYLRRPPTLSASSSFRSRTTPVVHEQVSFEVEVLQARDLTEEQISHWIAEFQGKVG